MKPLETAWQRFRAMTIRPDASDAQVEDVRIAFFAGASVLQTILLRGLEDTGNPNDCTPADLKLMAALQEEIDAFGQELDLRVLGRGRPS